MERASHVQQEELHQALVAGELQLSLDADRIRQAEYETPVNVQPDTSLRLKVLDQCGMACTFCHNEGTPVTADNVGRTPSEYQPEGQSSRVSIYLNTNQADFLSGMVRPDITFSEAAKQLSDSIYFDEVHLTGGEPTLHPDLPQIVSQLKQDGQLVKITSNGERFSQQASALKEAGLDKVVFSIFGTTPTELAEIQGGKFKNEKFGALKLAALDRSINAAREHGISAAANIVLPDLSHADRVIRVIEKYGDDCKIRILNSLDQGAESYEAVYELLARLGAVPKQVNITAGASGMSVDYVLPDGKEIGFKQIRKSYLPKVCDDCFFKDNGCDEGYYGVRMYVDRDNQYRVGVCIQRMDLTRPIDEFTNGDLPAIIAEHRKKDYYDIMNKVGQ